MLISEYKILFIHIPKTGGVTIGNIIHPNYTFYVNNKKKQYSDYFTQNKIHVEHDYFSNYEKIIGKDIKNYFVFSFVRNPYTRVFSLWRQCCDAHSLNKYKSRKITKVISCDINQTKTIEYIQDRESTKQFQNFIKTLYQEKHQIHLLGNTQYSMITNKQANFIGRYESFEQDLKKVIDLLNNFVNKSLNFDIDNRQIFKYNDIHTNKRSKTPDEYKNFYNTETYDLVKDIYHQDFDEFNYTKETI